MYCWYSKGKIKLSTIAKLLKELKDSGQEQISI